MIVVTLDEQLLQQAESELAGWADPVARLKQAIENNEFQLFCQPILALAGAGGYPMAEILVRMREEERALLPPGDFLPVLEHYRMMPQFDRWVVRHTIMHIAAGSRIGGFSINLSGQTLDDPEFPRYVAAQLSASNVPPGALAFEIDENDTLARLPAAAQFGAACHEFGGKLMIDAFGRRSVSFTAIKTLGAAFVKVDGSIVRKIVTSDVARTKMRAILRVGNALGFAIVGECVEEQDVLVGLKALGVGFAQGFGIHLPLSITSFANTATPTLVSPVRPRRETLPNFVSGGAPRNATI